MSVLVGSQESLLSMELFIQSCIVSEVYPLEIGTESTFSNKINIKNIWISKNYNLTPHSISVAISEVDNALNNFRYNIKIEQNYVHTEFKLIYNYQ